MTRVHMSCRQRRPRLTNSAVLPPQQLQSISHLCQQAVAASLRLPEPNQGHVQLSHTSAPTFTTHSCFSLVRKNLRLVAVIYPLPVDRT